MVFDKCFSQKQVSPPKKQGEPWYDSELNITYKAKQSLYKKLMRKSSELNKQKYCKARNKYDRMIQTGKQNYIKSKLDENKYILRETRRMINNLLRRKSQQQTYPMSINGTLVTYDIIVAHHFNDYFSSVADN